MRAIALKNVIIKELKDKNQNPYYLILDDREIAYFCFSKSLKEG
jgi:hypothetical protein